MTRKIGLRLASAARKDRSVYVITNGSSLKNGKSDDAKKRMASLQTASHRKLRLLFSVEIPCGGADEVELACHRKLSGKRSFGEWFSCSQHEAFKALFECASIYVGCKWTCYTDAARHYFHQQTGQTPPKKHGKHRQKTLFQQICEIDPQILNLYQEAKLIKDGGGSRFCANEIWYRVFKPQIVNLVGMCRKTGPDILQSNQAYDAVYETIYKQLPDCRKCNCFSFFV